ncbi:MAG: hypothetical protein AB8F95_00930 [Bacteroidia bacterium]
MKNFNKHALLKTVLSVAAFFPFLIFPQPIHSNQPDALLLAFFPFLFGAAIILSRRYIRGIMPSSNFYLPKWNESLIDLRIWPWFQLLAVIAISFGAGTMLGTYIKYKILSGMGLIYFCLGLGVLFGFFIVLLIDTPSKEKNT